MNRWIIVIIATGIAPSLVLSAADAPLFALASRPPIVGSSAPAFTLPDLEGQTRSLSDYRGSVVLLNFWATWCKPCKKEMPTMQAASDELTERGLIVLAVNELEETDRVRSHIRKHGYTFTVLLDHDNRVANMYGVVGLPVTVFIDQTGRVQKYIRGELLTTELIHETVTQLIPHVQSQPRHAVES